MSRKSIILKLASRMHENAFFRCNFAKFFWGMPPDYPRMAVPSALPIKLICDETLAPLENFLRAPLVACFACINRELVDMPSKFNLSINWFVNFIGCFLNIWNKQTHYGMRRALGFFFWLQLPVEYVNVRYNFLEELQPKLKLRVLWSLFDLNSASASFLQ